MSLIDDKTEKIILKIFRIALNESNILFVDFLLSIFTFLEDTCKNNLSSLFCYFDLFYLNKFHIGALSISLQNKCYLHLKHL